MTFYRFYLMVGTTIIAREERDCDDDRAAAERAAQWLSEAGATYDAIEVWDRARRVLRHERGA
jgi:hypothetical protein